jgi:MYXO-CTERM domain-containing protein
MLAPMRASPRIAVVLSVVMAAPALIAQPRDTWVRVRTGVDYLHRTTTVGPQDIFAARIDLRTPGVGLHASADNVRERAVTTPTFARNVGALVAINADWSDGRTPVGIAISDGALWHGHIPNDRLAGRWGYFGCTVDKRCDIGNAAPLATDPTLATPTARPLRFFEGVGANGVVLISNGAPRTGCYDTARNPRSAIGFSEDRNTLWLVVVDGRRSTAAGMTCDETRTLMAGLGCYEAAMLDGGGSSTLFVDGSVRNTPSDGTPRTVANHLAVMFTATPDARCTVPSGRSCSGTRITTCQGGRFLSTGDCATFGATCEAQETDAYCVDGRCPGGRGNATGCAADGRVVTCVEGAYSAASCPAGQVCGVDATGGRCVDARCAAAPNGNRCTASGLVATCAAGAYREDACAGSNRCLADAMGAVCADPRCATPDARRCDGANHLVCARGVLTLTPCNGATTCDAARGCVASIDAGPTPVDAGPTPVDAPVFDAAPRDAHAVDRAAPPDGAAEDVSADGGADGAATPVDVAVDAAADPDPDAAAQSGCACSLAGAPTPGHGALGGLLALLLARRRRRAAT